MTKQQLEYLKCRLRDLKYAKQGDYRHWRKNPPAAVKAAQKVIDRWESEQSKAEDARRAKIEQAYNRAFERILFSDNPELVSKMVEEFEKWQPC